MLHASPNFSFAAEAVMAIDAVAVGPAIKRQVPLDVIANDALPLPSRTVTQDAVAVIATDALPVTLSIRS